MLNRHRHYFLYAKGHYLITDMFEDLKKIQCNYVGCDLNANITKGDIIRVTTHVITELVNKHLPLDHYVEALCYYGKKNVSPFDTEYKDVPDAIIAANLGILRHATIHEIKGELGKIDENILPSHREVKG